MPASQSTLEGEENKSITDSQTWAGGESATEHLDTSGNDG